MKLDVKEYERKMQKSVDAYLQLLVTVRAGRANPEILQRVNVDYYGVPTAVNQMAEVRTTDARTLVIQPWDASTLKNIEKAILASDIGITPQSDGKVIRLLFPQPTEERRLELKKQVSKMGEEAKVAIRNIRREANDTAKNMKKKGEMTEDELKSSEKMIQDLTDRVIKQIDEITDKKHKEIMEI
ncbi:MAG: ribosome recycling factor [Clostridiales bacterium]|nr:ribosome recycling factor [Clostridiales bacterium]